MVTGVIIRFYSIPWSKNSNIGFLQYLENDRMVSSRGILYFLQLAINPTQVCG